MFKHKINNILFFIIVSIILILTIIIINDNTPKIIYKVYSRDVVVEGYSGKIKNVEIKNIYEGKPVTGISRNAFEKCQSLETIIIPEGVTLIDDLAFASCTNLKESN